MSPRKPTPPPPVIIRKKRPSTSTATTVSAVQSRPVTSKTSGSHTTPSSFAQPQLLTKPESHSSPSSVSKTIATPAAPAGPNRKQRDFYARQELQIVLQQRWPQLFAVDPRQSKPFALGIHQELLHQLPETKPYVLRQTLRVLQNNGWGEYWRAILRGGPRYGLDGIPKGEVTAEEQAYVREQLALPHQKKQGRRRPTAPSQGHTDRTLPPATVTPEEPSPS